MTGHASWELQKAIYTALSGDATLGALVTGIYDHIPEGSALPYVQIGECWAEQWDTKTESGMESFITLHSFSRNRGKKSITDIMAENYRILHNANLTVTGQTLVLLQQVMEERMLDDDGKTYHGVQRFRALTEGV